MKYSVPYVLAKKFKHRQWSLSGNNLEDVVYRDNEPAITQAELEAADAELAKLDYQLVRKYPNIGEQLDALWHSMDTGEIPKSNAFYEMNKAVKDANPKGVL